MVALQLVKAEDTATYPRIVSLCSSLEVSCFELFFSDRLLTGLNVFSMVGAKQLHLCKPRECRTSVIVDGFQQLEH